MIVLKLPEMILTPNQIDLIDDSSIDIPINTFSFQEMTSAQIKKYFLLMQRAGKEDSLSFVVNRDCKASYTDVEGDHICPLSILNLVNIHGIRIMRLFYIRHVNL